MRFVSKYEVACPTCRVSYPPEQKRCVHCGGKTTKSIVEVPDAAPEFADAVGHAEPEPAGPVGLPGDAREIVFFPRDAAEEEEEDAPRGGVLRKLGGLVWIIMFVVLTAVRMCAED